MTFAFTLLNEIYAKVIQHCHIIELHCFKGKSDFRGYFNSIPKVKTIIQSGNYDIIHIHAGRPALLVCGLLSTLMAQTKGIRIVHSHSTLSPNHKKGLQKLVIGVLNGIISFFLNHGAHYQFACSKAAGKYMFGKKAVHREKVIIMSNAIDINSFLYDRKRREKIHKDSNLLSNEAVVGHIGRFVSQKNHIFLIKVFQRLLELRSCCILWLIGDGPLRKEIELEVQRRQLEDRVIFWGEQKNVSGFLQGMDIMLFPSFYEGLSVTLVEAQTSDLQILASDNISKEHQLTDAIRFFPLSAEADAWAKEANIMLNEVRNRKNRLLEIRNAGYDILTEAQKLEHFYKSVISKEG